MVNAVETEKLVSVFRGTCKRHAEHDCIQCFYDVIERAAIMEYDSLSTRRQSEIDASADLFRRHKRDKKKRK